MAFEKERTGPLTYFCFIFPYFISPLFIIVINRGFKTKKEPSYRETFLFVCFQDVLQTKKRDR